MGVMECPVPARVDHLKDDIGDQRGSSRRLLPLLPLPMWKENPHIASVKHYADLVFSGLLRRIKRGQFIEETVGQEMLRRLKQAPSHAEAMKVHAKEFGTYLLFDGHNATSHLDGRC